MQNPQLTKALFQAQIMLGMVKNAPQVCTGHACLLWGSLPAHLCTLQPCRRCLLMARTREAVMLGTLLSDRNTCIAVAMAVPGAPMCAQVQAPPLQPAPAPAPHYAQPSPPVHHQPPPHYQPAPAPQAPHAPPHQQPPPGQPGPSYPQPQLHQPPYHQQPSPHHLPAAAQPVQAVPNGAYAPPYGRSPEPCCTTECAAQCVLSLDEESSCISRLAMCQGADAVSCRSIDTAPQTATSTRAATITLMPYFFKLPGQPSCISF